MKLAALQTVERVAYFQRLYKTLEGPPPAATAKALYWEAPDDVAADGDRYRHNIKIGATPMKLATLNTLVPATGASAAVPMLSDYDGKEVTITEVRIDSSGKRPRGFVSIKNGDKPSEVGASVILCKMLQSRFGALAAWAKTATPEQLAENGVALFIPKVGDDGKPVMNGKDPVMVENPDALVLDGTVKKLDRGVTLE